MNNEEDILTIGIGFDQVESKAWHTMVHSIMARASRPVRIIPIKQSNLIGIYNRPVDPRQSNEFSFTRFLLPFLCGFKGKSVFFDCDMLLRDDIYSILDHFDDSKTVHVVKHDYIPHDQEKFLGAKQLRYEKKNWSSVMLFNNEKCKALTPEYVNTSTGLELHQFKWVGDDYLIGDLPLGWNWLVGEYHIGYGGVNKEDVKNVHFTVGGPWFIDYALNHIDFADEWYSEHALADFALQRESTIAGMRPKWPEKEDDNKNK